MEIPKGTRYCTGSVLHGKTPGLTSEERQRAIALVAALQTLMYEECYSPHTVFSDRTKKYLDALSWANNIGGIDAVREVRTHLAVDDDDVFRYRVKITRAAWMSAWDRVRVFWEAVTER